MLFHEGDFLGDGVVLGANGAAAGGGGCGGVIFVREDDEAVGVGGFGEGADVGDCGAGLQD